MYTIVVLESDGSELYSTEESTFKDAKVVARRVAKDRELVGSGARKVEIRDTAGECVWDRLMITKAQLGYLELYETPVTDVRRSGR